MSLFLRQRATLEQFRNSSETKQIPVNHFPLGLTPFRERRHKWINSSKQYKGNRVFLLIYREINPTKTISHLVYSEQLILSNLGAVSLQTSYKTARKLQVKMIITRWKFEGSSLLP